MGSFNLRCAVSGLPIAGYDRVKVVLLCKYKYRSRASGGPWVPFSPPIEGRYNTYGRAEGVNTEGPLVTLTLEYLRENLQERPWGQNTCHDVPVSKDQDFDTLLGTICNEEGRVRFMRGKGKSPPVVGDVTWKEVQRILDEAGMKNFIADEVEPGIVRVRYNDYSERPWGKIRETLTSHYDVVERYEHGPERHNELPEDRKGWDVWFQVTRKGWSLDEHIALDAQNRKQRLTQILESSGHKGYGSSFYKPQKVGAAMVRAEVWEGMVALGGMDLGWGSPDTIDAFVEKAKVIAREGVKILQSGSYPAHFFIENLFRDNRWFVEGGYQGVDRLFVRYIEHLSEGTMPESQLEHIARGVGETVLVESYMRWMGAMWAPSSYMSEGLPTDLQVAFHKIVSDALTGIVKKREEYDNG